MIRWLILCASCLVLLNGCAGFFGSLFTSTSSEFAPPSPDGISQRIRLEGNEPNGEVDHFAVLIGADTELRHRGNLSLAYQVLLEQGYERDRVFILDSEGQTPFFPLTDVTTKEAIQLLFEHLARVVEPHDSLFIYVTGHGRRVKADEDDNGDSKTLGVSTLSLNPGEELSQEEFALMLERIKPGVGIAFFDQCYWGQFKSPKLCNFVTITTSDPDETSHGVSFPRAFWRSFRERRDGQGPPTILEAFKYAMVSDKATRLGLNRPRISHMCIDPTQLMLLGDLRLIPTDLAGAAGMLPKDAAKNVDGSPRTIADSLGD